MEEEYFTLAGKNNETWKIGPDKAALYRHLGSNAMYDNITAQLQENPPMFTRIFRHQEGYGQLERYIAENGFPMHINLRHVGAAIVKSFEQSISMQIDDIDSVPEDWDE